MSDMHQQYPDHSHDLNAAESHDTRDIEQIHQAVFREKPEPEDGMEPIPLWIVGLCGLAIFLGGLYLGDYSGGWRADVFSTADVTYGPVKDGGAKQVDPKVLGKVLYTKNCVACHQASGKGLAGQYPTLIGTEQVLGPANRLVKLVLHGLNGPITVEGTTYNGNMPSQKDALNDQQIAYILTYVRSEWGNNASPISPEFVAKVRESSKDRRQSWTWPELAAIPGEDDTASAAPAPAADTAKK